MTAQEELTKLEAAYGAWLDAGCPQSMTMNGRTMVYADFIRMQTRVDQLRAATARQGHGMFVASQFRKPE